MSSDQNPPSSPYEPPSGSAQPGGDQPSTGSGYEPPVGGGAEPPVTGGTGYEPPTSGGGYPPPAGSGSVYESSAYQTPGGAVPGGPAPGAYGQTPPQPAPVAAGGKNNTQLFGILGIVLGVVCCAPLGILFGWMSMNEAKKTGADDTLGKVAFWLGIGLVAIWLVAAIIAICAGGLGSWSNDRY